MPRLPLTLTFDRLTFKLLCESHLPSKFRHARPLGSRSIRYVHDGRTGQTNGQTDGQIKATLIAPFPTVGGIINGAG